MTEAYIKSEYDACERLGFTHPLMNERRRNYWDSLQDTDGYYLITQAQKDFLDSILTGPHTGITWSLTSSSATTISESNTLYKLAGTTTVSEASGFSQTGNNEITYLGDSDKFNIFLSLSISGGENDDVAVQLRKYDSSSAGYTEIGPEVTTTIKSSTGSSRIENVSIMTIADLDTDDRVEVWAKNKTDTSNVTGEVGSHLVISRRL